MAIVIANAGELVLLEAFVGLNTAQDLNLSLFVNNYTPVKASTAADFTECSLAGYSSIPLAANNWNSAVAATPSYIEYPQQTFTFTYNGSQSPVYGYYLTQAISGNLVYAERFAVAPRYIEVDTDEIIIPLRIEIS